MIEKLTGTTWDQAMRDRLFTPLGLARTVTLPEEALLHSAAVGHVDVDGEQVPSPTWGLMRSVGPAGLVTSTVADVLAFARLHLAGGLAADGTRVLSEESAAAMTAHEADLPDKYILGDSWGLGWIRFGWDGQRLIGHDGNTLGQAAFLRILPEQGLAVALLTNGGHTRDLYEDLYRELFAELAERRDAAPADATRGAGRRSTSRRTWAGTSARRSAWRCWPTGPPCARRSPDRSPRWCPTRSRSTRWSRWARRCSRCKPPEAETWAPVTFYELPTGERYVHFGVRATPRVD